MPMTATEDNGRAAPGKPAAVIDHASVAPAEGGGISITVTITIGLDDLTAIDLLLRAMGTLARARGAGVVL
jgi:hypothetical protein